MLRDVALRSAYRLDDVLHARLLLAENAEYLEPQGMSDGAHGVSHSLDLLPAAYQIEDVPRLMRSPLLSNFHGRSL